VNLYSQSSAFSEIDKEYDKYDKYDKELQCCVCRYVLWLNGAF